LSSANSPALFVVGWAAHIGRKDGSNTPVETKHDVQRNSRRDKVFVAEYIMSSFIESSFA